MANYISKIVVAVIGFGMWFNSAAQACDPPHVGDQFQYNDGTVMELAKPVVDRDCHWEKRKACFRPAGSKQPCRWIKFPDDLKDGKWVVNRGDHQD